MGIYTRELLRWFFLPLRFYLEIGLGSWVSFSLLALFPFRWDWLAFLAIAGQFAVFVGAAWLLVKRAKLATELDSPEKPAESLRAALFVMSFAAPVIGLYWGMG